MQKIANTIQYIYTVLTSNRGGTEQVTANLLVVT